MASALITRFVEQLGAALDAADRPMLLAMGTWFDRSSLWPATWARENGELVIYFANEAERYRLPLATLRALYAGMRRGEAVDWGSLQRIR